MNAYFCNNKKKNETTKYLTNVSATIINYSLFNVITNSVIRISEQLGVRARYNRFIFQI